MGSKSYRINRLIQDLNSDPTARLEFEGDPPTFFASYEITADEQQLLADGSIEALGALGMHPNLQMKWLLLRPGAKRSGPAPLSTYLDKLLNAK